LSAYSSACLSTFCPPAYPLFIRPLIRYLSAHLSAIYPPTYPQFIRYLSAYLSAHPSAIHPPTYPLFVRPFIRLLIRPPIRYSSACLSAIYPPIHPQFIRNSSAIHPQFIRNLSAFASVVSRGFIRLLIRYSSAIRLPAYPPIHLQFICLFIRPLIRNLSVVYPLFVRPYVQKFYTLSSDVSIRLGLFLAEQRINNILKRCRRYTFLH
jgi:hypothetical protein